MINKKYLRTMGIGLFLLSFSWFGCETEDPAVIFDGDSEGIWERLIQLLDAKWVSTENQPDADTS